jgi:iron complex transport system ATP-binding protein
VVTVYAVSRPNLEIRLDGVMTVDDPARAAATPGGVGDVAFAGPAGSAGFQVNEDAVLQMQDVTVQRGTKILLDSIDWTVELDERWVVLGANGAGKTTLLQIAAAQLHPSDGIVYILGERLGAVDVFELRPRIGLTSASLAQRIPNREIVGDIVISAGYSVVGRWREAYGRADRRRATRILGQLGVGELRERQFGTLSEGERKRVQIARALMTDPELMLLDEPAAGMDLGGREDLLRRLTRLARRADAPASVLVTHHVEEIPVGTTHALLLRDGMIVASGLIRDVLTSETLSETFALPVLLERVAGRYYARAAPRTRRSAASTPAASTP